MHAGVVSGLRGRRRILVVGCSGAGKSTLARRLGAATGLPVIHLDRHFWLPGWKQMERGRWRVVLDELLARPEWIMDGAYVSTLPRRLEVADGVVRLDVGRGRCLANVARRIATTYGRNRPDIGEGCPEKVDPSFVRWVWNWHRDEEPPMLRALAAAPPDVRVWTLRSRREIDRFVGSVHAPGERTPGAID